MRLPLLAYYLPSRGILVTLACAVGGTGLQFGSYSLFSRSELPLPLMTMVMAFGTAFAWMMGIRFVAGNSKLSEFEAVLPVATRDLALIRTLAMAVFWLMPVWAGFATIMTISASKGMAEQVVAHGLALTLSVSGCVLLATVIRYRALRAEPSRFQSLALGLLTIALMFVGFFLPFAAVGGAGFVLAAIAAGVFYRSAPLATELPVASAKRPASTKAHAARSYSLHRHLVNRCLLSWRSAMWIVFLLVMSILSLIGGGASNWYMLFFFVGMSAWWSLQSLRVLAHLPIRRQRLFAYVVLPPIAVLLLGSAIGATIGHFIPQLAGRNGDLIEFYRKRDSSGAEAYDLYVPADLWKVTTGKPPLITAPNGESLTPTAHSIGPFTVYNPYEVGYKPGTEFLSFQLSRALGDCCDVDLTPEQVQRRYLSDEDWHHGLDQEDHPELRERSMADFVLHLVLVTMISLAVLSAVFYRNRPAASRLDWIKQQVARLAAPVVVLGGAMVVMFRARWTYVARPDEPELAGPVWNLVKRLFADNLGYAIPAALAVIVVSYLVLQRRFQHMEPPAPPNTPIPDRSLVEV